jgi:hypothetical protein
MDSVHGITVESLVDWCIQRGLDPSEVTLSAGHLKWDSPETDAERERREHYAALADQRRIDWENETIARLILARNRPGYGIYIPMTWEQYQQINGSKLEYYDGCLVIS